MKLGRRGFRDEKETSAFEGERWFGVINANRILNGGVPGDEWEINRSAVDREGGKSYD